MASFLVRALKFVFSTVPHTVPYLKLSVVRVRLVDAVRLLPNQQVLVEVKLQWEGAVGLPELSPR